MPRDSSNETCHTNPRLINAVIMTERTTLLACDHSLEAAGTRAAIAGCGRVTAATFSHAGGSSSTSYTHYVLIVRRWRTVRSPHLGTCPLHQHIVPHLALCNLNYTALINIKIWKQSILTMSMSTELLSIAFYKYSRDSHLFGSV